MKILELKTDGYRNLEKSDLKFSPGINFIYGKNAQGKTNLIESIWMFTGARSFRGTKDLNLINFERENARIEGKFFFEGRNQEISVFFSQGKRKVFLNGIGKPYPTNIIGKFRVVVFSPVQLLLINGGPEVRRKFLDAAICQLKPTYVSKILKYNQVLKNRNAFLKELGNSDSKKNDYNSALLDVWDEKLSEIGALVTTERINYVKFLKEKSYKIYGEISNQKEVFDIKYICALCKNPEKNFSFSDLKKEFNLKLKKNYSSDLKSGFTNFGPHKDDIDIFVDKKRVKFFGSQGQMRSAALCLKLAEAEILEENIGEPPVILLDDVMSELDDLRKSYMINKIKGKQVFITNCDCSFFENLKKSGIEGKLFEITNGKIKEINDL